MIKGKTSHVCGQVGGRDPVQNPRQNAEKKENRQDVKDLRVSDEKEIDDRQLNDIMGVGSHNTDAHEAEVSL